MATIYELKYQYQALQNFIEEGNEEGFELALSQIEDSLAEKLEGYAMVKANIESDIDGVDKEIKRLNERKKSMIKNIDRIKETMFDTLQSVDGNKLKTDKFTFSLRKSTAVNILDENMIPLNFFIPQQPKIDKISIKENIKKGIIVPGAEIKENKSLSIR